MRGCIPPTGALALLVVALGAGCSRESDTRTAARPASAPASAASAVATAPASAAPASAAASDVMLSAGGATGALAGTGGTYGGPSGFGGPGEDSEKVALADAPSKMVDPTRGSPRLMEEPRPAPLYPEENKDLRRVRAFAMQPPTIPHKIEGYQVDRNANRCLFCHGRTRTEESQAPMVSVSHFQDRDGNFLAELSPRRYFCTQCHVSQAETRPLVENRFVDVDTMVRAAPSAASSPPRAAASAPGS